MALVKRGETWYASLVHEGQRVRQSLGTSDRREAQRLHDELKASLWSAPKRRQSEHTWLDACIRWLTVQERSNSERYSLRALSYADVPLQEITAVSLEEALVGKSASTYMRYRGMITAILNGAKEAGWLDTVPAMKVRKVATGRTRFLSQDEWTRLYAELPAHLKPMAHFAVQTGLRQRNVTQLRWDQIDLARRVCWIHPDESKSGHAIGIPLSDDAVQVLNAQDERRRALIAEWRSNGQRQGKRAPQTDFVFLFRGAPITKIKNSWQDACHRAGLGIVERSVDAQGRTHRRYSGFTWHGLRHTWASAHTMSGTPLDALQRLGGWTDARMVQKYAHLAPEYLASFANNARPWCGAKLDPA